MAAQEKPDIPPQVCAAYTLLYNNVTYQAVRKALEEAAAYGQLSDDKSNVEFIDEIMNRLIDATLERCGSTYYQGAEAALMHRLNPLVSNFSGLVQRHLSNFGPSPEASARPSSELLQVTRADLHGIQHDLHRDATSNAHMAAH